MKQRIRQAKLGCAPAHKLFELVRVIKKPEVDAPRNYRDYHASICLSRVPAGVRVCFKTDAFSEIIWDHLPQNEDWFRAE